MAIGIVGVALMGCGMPVEEKAADAVEQAEAVATPLTPPTPTPTAPPYSNLSEDERKGFHCLSPWDGNHDGLEGLIRDELNDPGSMETYERVRITVSCGLGV